MKKVTYLTFCLSLLVGSLANATPGIPDRLEASLGIPDNRYKLTVNLGKISSRDGLDEKKTIAQLNDVLGTLPATSQVEGELKLTAEINVDGFDKFTITTSAKGPCNELKANAAELVMGLLEDMRSQFNHKVIPPIKK